MKLRVLHVLLFIVPFCQAGYTGVGYNKYRVHRDDPESDKTLSLSTEITNSHRKFSLDILQHSYFHNSGMNFGYANVLPMEVAYILAVINEKHFDVKIDRISNALRVPQEKVMSTYQSLVENLSGDPNTHISSTIYTSDPSMQATQGLANLGTEIIHQEFNNDTAAAINARIVLQTFGKIYGSLIPDGNTIGPSIGDFTQAIFTNTFLFTSKFATNVIEIESRPFYGFSRSNSVSTLEATGHFKIRHSTEFKSVIIPLNDGRKDLVLVLPRDDLVHLTPYLDDVLDFDKIRAKPTKKLSVQFPKLNISHGHQFFSSLYHMGINNTMCEYKDHVNFLQPVAQAVHINISPDTFEVAAATGVQLNNREKFLKAYNETDFLQHLDMNREVIRNQSKNFHVTKPPPLEDTDERLSRRAGEILEFNRPFLWYINDQYLGPVFFGSVHAIHNLDDISDDIFNAWTDVHRYLFWSCLSANEDGHS